MASRPSKAPMTQWLRAPTYSVNGSTHQGRALVGGPHGFKHTSGQGPGERPSWL